MSIILNKYMITDKEVSTSAYELALIFINENGKILINNEDGIINVPRVRSMHGKINVKNKIKGLLGNDDINYYLLDSITNYRYCYKNKYGMATNQRTDVDYYVVKVNSKDIDKQFAFLSVPHLKSLINMQSGIKGYEYIKEELDIILNKLSTIYENKRMISGLNIGDYANHLVSAYYFNNDNKQNIKQRRRDMQMRYPYLDYKNIYCNTLEFVSDIYDFAYQKSDNSLKFGLDKIIPIKTPTQKLWYSDILLVICKDNTEYLVSTYLLKVLLDDKFNFTLNCDPITIKDSNKEIGEISLLPEFIIFPKDNKITSMSSIGKLKKLCKERY